MSDEGLGVKSRSTVIDYIALPDEQAIGSWMSSLVERDGVSKVASSLSEQISRDQLMPLVEALCERLGVLSPEAPINKVAHPQDADPG